MLACKCVYVRMKGKGKKITIYVNVEVFEEWFVVPQFPLQFPPSADRT